jgi:O-antigen ligase
MIPGLLGGIGLVLILLRWPSLGLIIASVVGMVVPFRGPSGLSTTMLLVALLLGLWLLDIMVRQREIRLVSSRPIGSLLAFVIVSLLSFGIGQLPWFTFASHAPLGAQLGGLTIVVMSAGAFLLVANQVRDLYWLSRLTWVFLAFAALLIVVRSVLPLMGLPTRNLLQSVGATFPLWVVAMAFSQAAFNRDLHPGWRLALAGLVLTTFYVSFILKFADKSGWIPLFISIGAIMSFRSWRVGVVVALVGALAAVYLKAQAIGTDQYSVETRFDAWVIMVEIIKTNPILGLGFANYYFYTPLFPIRGYAVSFNSHNNYVDIIAQTGLVGVACYLWFFWEAAWLCWRLRERVPTGFAQAYLYGALGGLAGTVVIGMLGDWVLPFFYNIGLDGFRSSVVPWLFLGGLISLEQMTRQFEVQKEE